MRESVQRTVCSQPVWCLFHYRVSSYYVATAAVTADGDSNNVAFVLVGAMADWTGLDCTVRVYRAGI